jgi:hypothetical protein
VRERWSRTNQFSELQEDGFVVWEERKVGRKVAVESMFAQNNFDICPTQAVLT